MRARLAPFRELTLMWVLSVLAMALGMTSQPDHWSDIWPMASAAADKGVTLAAPVLAAMACAVTQRRRASRPPDLMASLPRRSVVLRVADLLRIVLVGVAVAVTAHGATWGIAALSEASGTPIWRYPVLTATTLSLIALSGVVVGRVLRHRAAAVLAAFIAVGVVLLWPRAGVMDFWYVVSIWPQLTVSLPVMCGRVTLLVVAVVALALSSRTDWYRTWAATAATVCVLMVVSMLGAPSVLRSPTGQVCTGTDLTICLWPDNAVYLPQVAAQEQSVVAAVDGSLPTPGGPLLEEGLSTTTGSTSVVVGGSDVTVRMGSAELAGSILSAWIDTSPSCPGRFAQSDEAWTARHRWEGWVHQRLAEAGVGPIGAAALSEADQAALDEVLTLPEAEQIAWASDQAFFGQGCAQ